MWSENIVCVVLILGTICGGWGRSLGMRASHITEPADQPHSQFLHQALPPFRESSLNSWKKGDYLQEEINFLGCNPLSLRVWRGRERGSKCLRAARCYTCVLTGFSTWEGLEATLIFSPSPQPFHFPHMHNWAALANFQSMEVMGPEKNPAKAT